MPSLPILLVSSVSLVSIVSPVSPVSSVSSVLELDQLKIPGWSDGAELDVRLSSFRLGWRWDLH